MYLLPRDYKIFQYCIEINIIVKIGKAEKVVHFRFWQIKPLSIFLVGAFDLRSRALNIAPDHMKTQHATRFFSRNLAG